MSFLNDLTVFLFAHKHPLPIFASPLDKAIALSLGRWVCLGVDLVELVIFDIEQRVDFHIIPSHRVCVVHPHLSDRPREDLTAVVFFRERGVVFSKSCLEFMPCEGRWLRLGREGRRWGEVIRRWPLRVGERSRIDHSK